MPNAANSCIISYIEACPQEHQQKLLDLHTFIQSLNFDLEEKISWNMPTYKKMANLFHFASHHHHLGIYPGPQAIVAFQKRLLPYKSSKGAFQIP